MRVTVATENESNLWNSFVEQHEACVNYHRWPWKRVIEQALGWRSHYLMAVDKEMVKGILPLFWQKSALFGTIFCSIPFFSQAGVVAEDEEVQDALLLEAIRIARDLKAEYLELRQRGIALSKMNSKKNKAMLVCDVYPDMARNMQRLTTKMRTNVRRALKTSLIAEFGGSELLEDFYRIFSLRMRELGTPVYSQRFFEVIFENFPKEAFTCRVRNQGKTISGAIVTGYRRIMEVNWSASDPSALALRPNIFLFWNLLNFVGRQGYSVFDFGRSSVGSGTYNFKLQWGAQPVQLYWNYWTPSGRSLDLSPDNPKFRAAIWLWKRMPLVFTQLVGPFIARHLP
ncbi:MAG TPA: FemAB family XrtA/PEP-CTERM system-associated protein [Candidatus Acidoferrales bacterium]|nr:FemAB family XrtA/PEP-CTERM system-associated protein [Candidatus Acidoferrales bacterium]